MVAKPNPLRAVEEGETASKRPPKNMTILEAAEADDRLEEMRSMRRRIALTLDNENTPARDLAALSRRQLELGKEIDALLAREKEQVERGSVADDSFDAAAI